MEYVNKPILAIYDVSGIQEYIFASNRLRENVGASRIVGNILKKDLPDVIEKAAKDMQVCVNLNWYEKGSTGQRTAMQSFEIVEDESIAAQTVYIGGGSAIVAFRNIEFYMEVNKRFAKCIIATTYTLSLAVAQIETDFEYFVKDRKALENELQRVKSEMLRQRPFGAFPISEQEGFGGLPVTASLAEYGGDKLSTVQYLKQCAAQDEEHDQKENRRREVVSLPPYLQAEYTWAFEMNELVREKGEDGYVAVLHIDGNGMGDQMNNRMEQWEKDSLSYSKAVHRMRALSLEISTGYREKFDQVVERITSKYKSISTNKNKKILKIRPLIMDGDDLTLICTAELGVPFAVEFLRELEKSEQSKESSSSSISLSACAGIALVHSHFPFSLAYEIAEECCNSAKKKRHDEAVVGSLKDRRSYLDFHIVRGSYVQQIKEIREEASGQKEGGRPYVVGAVNTDQQAADSLDFLENCLQRIRPDEGDAAWPRTWLNRLYEVYIERNEDTLRALLEQLKSRGYQIEDLYNKAGLKLSNDDNSTSHPNDTIRDALELMDMYDRHAFDKSPSHKDSEVEV